MGRSASHACRYPTSFSLRPPLKRIREHKVPTIFSHVAVPLALRFGLGRGAVPTRLLVAGVVAAALPDLDVLAFRLNVAYSHALGHRGFSHSLVFALALALLALAWAPSLRSSRFAAFIFVGLAAVSHPLLDMFTNGGLGVALWWPWSAERFFAPWPVIEVSPLSLHRLFSARGVAVIKSELLWVCLPAVVVGFALLALRASSPTSRCWGGCTIKPRSLPEFEP